MSGAEPTRKRSPYARNWGDAALTAHPAPEVQCRPATTGEVPRSPKLMMARAEAAGWAVRATYARGTTMTAKGKPGKVVDSIALRFHMANRAAWAAWHNGLFDSAQVWERGGAPKSVGATELSTWLAAP